MFGDKNELLREIRDILKITQENQKDIIDLREQSMQMQKSMMEFNGKLERNEERARAADAKAVTEVKDHTAEHFVTMSLHQKTIDDTYKDINGMEERLNTKIKHKMELFAVAWTTATIILGSGLYLYEHVNVASWK